METTLKNNIDFSKLSPTELNELSKELERITKTAAREREENISAYKALVDELVKQVAPNLADFGTMQNEKVEETFKAFEEALKLKKELYGYKDEQASHTFTARDGSASVIIGYNEVIGFDGTENAGVQKIREFIKTLASDDDNRQILADLLETFMKPNKKGELNPTRVAELIAKKDTVANESFHEGVDIIVKAQFKTRTTTYVKGWIKRKSGVKELKLEFSISSR